MVNNTFIHLKNVSKSYNEQEVLKNISLEIHQGEFLTIIGGSGSGKTTFLKLINGLLLPNVGEIWIDGENISKKNLTSLRRQIGYSIQNIALFPHLTVKKNISFVPSLNKSLKKDSQLNEKLMQILHLDKSLLHRYPSELSGGQQQRVGIARALAAKPKILLMDEPFGAVDEITRESLQNEITRIHKELKTTILFVTHDIKEALKLGTRVLILKDGQIEQIDTPENIIAHPKSEYVKSLIHSFSKKVISDDTLAM